MKPRQILIIEDDKMLIKMYVIKFEKEGYIIDVAYNGIEGLEKINKKNYDVILLDLMMPIMDGFEMLRKTKDVRALKKTPLFILSNLGQKEDLENAKNLGIEEEYYLIKSNTTPKDVIKRIESVIE